MDAAMLEGVEWDSESEDGDAAAAAAGGASKKDNGNRQVNDLGSMMSKIGAESDFAWTTEHILLCRLISLYGKCATRPGGNESWIRATPLNVLIYECIAAGVLDFDYAPALTDVSYLGATKKVWLNLSQEAATSIDELRMNGLVRAVRMYTVDYKSVTAYQVSDVGLKMLKVVPNALFDELKHIVYVPDKDNTYSDKLQISWDAENEVFSLRSGKTGYTRPSTVTEIEDVSYVCSPFIPVFLRRGMEVATNNRKRATEAAEGRSNIADAEMMEAIALGEVRLMVVEWVPFGENNIVTMAQNLGVMDRTKKGMFSEKVDKKPCDTILKIPAGLTQVRVLDFDMMHFVNVEAEICYPEDEGIVQVEFFGIHVSTRGYVIFGLHIDSIMTRTADSVPIDLLTRMAVDVVQDTSKILGDMMSSHQRETMKMIFQGFPEKRKKFACYIAKSINPWYASSAQYLDRGDTENEIAQIIGPVRFGKDLGNKHFLFMGTLGLLCVGAKSYEYDAFLVPYCSLQAMMLMAAQVYDRFNHIIQMLDEAMGLTEQPDSDPYSVQRVQYLVAQSGTELGFMDVTVAHLADSIDRALMPPEPWDQISINIYAALKCRMWQTNVRKRANALRELIVASKRKLVFLRLYTDSINQHGLLKKAEAMRDDAKNLHRETVWAHRVSQMAWIAMVFTILLLSYRLLDLYRWGTFSCDVSPMYRQEVERFSFWDRIYNYTDPPGGIYSYQCAWVNDMQYMLQGTPFLLSFITVPFAIVVAFGGYYLSWLWAKRSGKTIPNAFKGWIVRRDLQTWGRISHTVHVNARIRVDRFEGEYLRRRRVWHTRNNFGSLVYLPGREASYIQVAWSESGPVTWLGLAPVVTAAYCRETGALSRVQFRVYKRLSGLNVG
eukprot:CAMPEP_0174943296 /NCGR_PEP_ID=MMETSP1355-20121228/76336_1 /TAXON_ID=464990 /ORGANISM="Hemiselmis tepida, Strain CCMP443" /LENGTH=888 /DNA_ID=CAMNT_0016190527 /DNA_START=8 /DNA_END=2670 /DNA_ORIENTATION=-